MDGDLGTGRSPKEDLIRTARSTARLLAEGGGLTSLVLLAVSWPFMLMVYRGLGCDPADVGIDGEWLLVRSVIGGVFLVIVSVVLLALPLRLGRRGLEALLFVISILILGLNGTLAISQEPDLLKIFAAGAVLTGILIWPLLAADWALQRLRGQHNKSLLDRRLVAVSILLICGLLALPFIGSRAVLAQIEKGQPVVVNLGIGLTVLSIEKVFIQAERTSVSADLDGTCSFLLGTSNGQVYLYDWKSRTLVRSPSGSVLLRSSTTCR